MTASADEQVVNTQWTLPKTHGIQSLVLVPDATLGSLADDEVRVRLHSASLNYRDLVIAKGGVPGDVKPGVVPGSDGAGVVEAVGKKVTKFTAGERVVTHLCTRVPDDQPPSMKDISAGLGQSVDGTLREFGNFHESALVHAPSNLSFDQAATLTCSGLTAWNALFGLKGRVIGKGDWVLIQGTGGVSVAALQFAVAAGASVVATTSHNEKKRLLEELGANYVINYREQPSWGSAARKLTPNERGFDLIVDVGGNDTLPESLEAIRTDGIIVATGLLGGSEVERVPMLKSLVHACTIRGILLGSRHQFKEMIEFVEQRNIHPVIDFRTWDLEETKRAYDWLDCQKHFSKVVIRLR